jgi:recombination protein RecT
MARTTTDVANRLEAKSVAKTTGKTVFDLIEQQRPAIQRALPKTGLTADRLARIIMTQIRTNPKLASCTAESLLGAVMLTAQLGLEPGPLGQAYFVPFGNQVQFIIGYKGLVSLAFRAGIVLSAHAIYESDRFQFDYGTDKVEHYFLFGQERGKLIGVWAKAVLPSGQVKIRVMTMAEVDSHRKRSRASDSGPWVTDYEAMSVKTVLRVLCAQLPLNTETQRALAADETSVVFNDDSGIIDIPESQVTVESLPEPQHDTSNPENGALFDV